MLVSRPRWSRTGVASLAAAAAIGALILLAGSGSGLLFVAPAIVAVVVLAAGWFPGEDALLAARERRAPAPVRAPRRTATPRAAGVLGRLLSPVAACAAGRAPPGLA